MIYKSKLPTPVDFSQIEIKLKSNQQTLLNIPYADSFDVKCDEQKEICTLTAKPSFFSLIQMNRPSNEEDLYIEIIYSCENEGIQQSLKEFLKNKGEITFSLKCPMQKSTSKCMSMFVPDKDVSTLSTTQKSFIQCDNPLFRIPRIVTNVKAYQEEKEKKKKEELEAYEEEILKLKVEKKIKEMKMHEEEITYEEALEFVRSGEKEKTGSWKRYENRDAVYPFLKDTKEIIGIEYYGMVYSIEDALRIANQKGETFFVWYHNTYSIQRFSSRLYFIHKDKMLPSSVDISNSSQWIQNENVTTCILEIERYENDLMNLIVSETLQNSEKMKENIHKIWEEPTTDEEMNTILYNLNRNFDSKIVSMGQSIQMNNHETTINNKILHYIYIILFFVFVAFVVVLTYYYYVSKGTVGFFRS
jgi:hypothetical protein